LFYKTAGGKIENMKIKIIAAAAIAVFFISCGTENYPDIRYQNSTQEDRRFRTTEREGGWHELQAGDYTRLPSDVRGRTNIDRIETKKTEDAWTGQHFYTWEYMDGDSYYIRFFDPDITLVIKNFSSGDIVIAEKFNLISYNPDNPEIYPINPLDLAKRISRINVPANNETTVAARLHTRKPVWHIAPEAGFRLVNKEGKRIQPGIDEVSEKDMSFFLGISPPNGDWWE
jgi:hypothetical protein